MNRREMMGALAAALVGGRAWAQDEGRRNPDGDRPRGDPGEKRGKRDGDNPCCDCPRPKPPPPPREGDGEGRRPKGPPPPPPAVNGCKCECHHRPPPPPPREGDGEGRRRPPPGEGDGDGKKADREK